MSSEDQDQNKNRSKQEMSSMDQDQDQNRELDVARTGSAMDSRKALALTRIWQLGRKATFWVVIVTFLPFFFPVLAFGVALGFLICLPLSCTLLCVTVLYKLKTALQGKPKPLPSHSQISYHKNGESHTTPNENDEASEREVCEVFNVLERDDCLNQERDAEVPGDHREMNMLAPCSPKKIQATDDDEGDPNIHETSPLSEEVSLCNKSSDSKALIIDNRQIQEHKEEISDSRTFLGMEVESEPDLFERFLNSNEEVVSLRPSSDDVAVECTEDSFQPFKLEGSDYNGLQMSKQQAVEILAGEAAPETHDEQASDFNSDRLENKADRAAVAQVIDDEGTDKHEMGTDCSIQNDAAGFQPTGLDKALDVLQPAGTEKAWDDGVANAPHLPDLPQENARAILDEPAPRISENQGYGMLAKHASEIEDSVLQGGEGPETIHPELPQTCIIPMGSPDFESPALPQACGIFKGSPEYQSSRSFLECPALQLHDVESPCWSADGVIQATRPTSFASGSISESEYESASMDDNQEDAQTEPSCRHVLFKSSVLESDKHAIEDAQNEIKSSRKVKMLRDLDAIKKIVGYQGDSHASLVDQIEALYMFTGMEPPPSIKEVDDLEKAREELELLKVVIGVK